MGNILSQHKVKQTKQLLQEYETQFPENTIAILTTVLTGRSDKSLADITHLLEKELQGGGINTNSEASETRYYLREWKSLTETLQQVPVSHTELRKYHPEHTPDIVEAADTTVVATGMLSTYQLSDSEYVAVVSQKPHGKDEMGITELKVVFTESPSAFFTRTLAPNDWYRPKDIGQ